MRHNRTNNTWSKMSRVIVEYWLSIFGSTTTTQAASATTHIVLAACFVVAFPIMVFYALVLAAIKYNETPARTAPRISELIDINARRHQS